MRKLLAELGIEPGDGLERLIDQAWVVHASREPESAYTRAVSGSSFLAAAVDLDVRIRSIFERHRLDLSLWKEMLKAGPQPSLSEAPHDYPVGQEVRTALEFYRNRYGGRPLDIPDFVKVLLPLIAGAGREALEVAGLQLEPAKTSLDKLGEPQQDVDSDAFVEFEALERFGAADSVQRLLRAARGLALEHDAPVTTSVMILAMSRPPGLESELTISEVGRAIRGDTNPEEFIKRQTEWMVWYGSKAGLASRMLVETFARASQLAESATGAPTIHGRHLVAALLTIPDDRDNGVGDVLRWLGANLERLVNLLMGIVESLTRSGNITDDLTVWYTFVFGTPAHAGPRHTLAKVDTEGTTGEDFLNFKRDWESFATLIAAKNLTPPLSIGLFGNWGSGKSFFMDKLRDAVAKLASDAEKAPFATGFHTRIVQIKFNAWHYVEGNLWASLVEHIFRNLKLSPDERQNVVDERRRYYVRQMDDAIAKRTVAEATMMSTELQRDALTRRITEEHKATNTVTEALNVAKNMSTEKLLSFTPEQRDAVENAGRALGLPRLQAAAGDARKAVEELRTVGGRAHRFLRWLVNGPGFLTRLLLTMAALFLGAAVAFVAGWLASDSRVAALVGQAAAILTAVAAWAGGLYRKFRPVMQELEAAQKAVQDAYAEAQAKKEKEIEQLEKEKQSAVDALEEARRQFNDAEAAAETARKALEKLRDDRQLVSFIDDRIESQDYRKLLGVLAVVRNDFENLSRLMSDASVVRAAGRHRIDRIVLYIDDLDRCPPRYVRDVLQAVHLLLAFPLFVVVVGVDARWVSRSLEREYRDQLRPEKGPKRGGSVAGYGATAYDYLEKIFQVPFWVQPLSEKATRDLLAGIVTVRDRQTPSLQPTPGVTLPAPPPPAPPTPVSPAPVPVQQPATPTPPPAPQPGDDRLTPALLKLEPEELEEMQKLAALIGRSPRSVKRFANIYRIIRASKTPAELAEFLDRASARGDFRFVLLLLGIVTGAPVVSTELFLAIARADPKQTVADFAAKAAQQPPGKSDEAIIEWSRACTAMTAFAASVQSAVLSDLQEHLREVSRYSFREPAL
jgi:cell division protein FtsB